MAKKVHHAPDYAKDRTADDIMKGNGKAVPDKQWQMDVDITPHGESNGWGAFLPRTSKSRPTPHTKTNECDN